MLTLLFAIAREWMCFGNEHGYKVVLWAVKFEKGDHTQLKLGVVNPGITVCVCTRVCARA